MCTQLMDSIDIKAFTMRNGRRRLWLSSIQSMGIVLPTYMEIGIDLLVIIDMILIMITRKKDNTP